jgi:electron transport complex protein RnfB
MNPELLNLALGGLAVLGCIGLFFGIGLALAAHKFHVKGNPKVEEVLEVLAGAQCGGCGYPGCEGYAEAVVNDPDVPPNLCFPGKEQVAKMVAEITGKKMATVENMVAAVRCSRVEGQVRERFTYIGEKRCATAKQAFQGNFACMYSCIGFGDCAKACPFGAINIQDGFPKVDPELCVGCGSCVRACPKGIIELMPTKGRVWVPCVSKDPGKTVKETCQVGCISCKMCVKVCPAKAVRIQDNVVMVDHKICMEYGPDCNEVCVEKCARGIFRKFSPVAAMKAYENQAKAEVA